MRNFLSRVLLAVAVFIGSVSIAHAEESIHLFDVQARLNPDRSATIQERLTYDFGEGEKHGIYRYIPDVYDRNGGSYKLHLQVQSVQMDNANVPYQVQSSGRNIQVKIGDSAHTYTGVHTYLIQYKTDRSLNDFADHVEWYWNLTGNGWLIPIEKVSLELSAPSSTQRTCFIGVYGSQENGCAWKDANGIVQVSSTRILSDGEGMTVVFGFPLGSFRTISTKEKILWFLQDNIWVGLPLLVFVLMGYIWYRYGKEPRGKGTIVPQYEEPRALPPALQTALVEQAFSQRAVTATILDLARRGYLHIQWQNAADFAFVKEKPADSGLHKFEKDILDGLFGKNDAIVHPGDLQKTFSKAIDAARVSAFDELRSFGWFDRNPVTVRAIWVVIAILTGVILFLLSNQQPIQVASSAMCAVIVAAFGWQMPRMKKEGAIVAEEVKGFKWFLSVTEEKRLSFTDAPAKKPEQFARFLPAAVALSIEKQWAHQFDHMMIPQPNYIRGGWQGWSALQMANTIDSMHHITASSMYTPPSSAGGGGSGFSGGGSGGGMGGGGGGSW